MFILPHGASFVNLTDSTYFAIPRYRVEKMLVRSQLADSIEVFWKRDHETQAQKIDDLQRSKGFWQTIAGCAAVIAGVLSFK